MLNRSSLEILSTKSFSLYLALYDVFFDFLLNLFSIRILGFLVNVNQLLQCYNRVFVYKEMRNYYLELSCWQRKKFYHLVEKLLFKLSSCFVFFAVHFLVFSSSLHFFVFIGAYLILAFHFPFLTFCLSQKSLDFLLNFFSSKHFWALVRSEHSPFLGRPETQIYKARVMTCLEGPTGCPPWLSDKENI